MKATGLYPSEIRLLVTDGSDFTGTNLIERYAALGAEVIHFDPTNLATRHTAAIALIL